MSNLALVLSEVSQGKIKRDAEQQFSELVEAIQKNGGKGSITIKLSIRQISDGSVEVSGEVTSKPSKAKLFPSIFFTTEDNLLVRNDPRQSELPLKVIRGDKPEEKPEQKEATA